jgi:poly-gamma-glutamate system protein
VAASLGGKGDNAGGMPAENRKLLEKAIERNNLEFISEQSIDADVIKRINMFDSYAKAPIKCYINVGGGHASLGSATNAILIPSGLSLDPSWGGVSDRGVIVKMAYRGIPILLFTRSLNQGVSSKQFLTRSRKAIPPLTSNYAAYT